MERLSKKSSYSLLFSLQQAKLGVLVMLTTAVLSACGGGGGGGGEVSDASAKTATIADQSIMQALYFDQRIPNGFYQLSFDDTNFSSLAHVKNVDILAPVDRLNLATYELSSNDFAQALAWSEAEENLLPVYRDLVDTRETNLYFEFTRVNMAAPDVSHFSRVFKSSALDRSSVDRRIADDDRVNLGVMSPSSVTVAQVKTVVEYLWLFSSHNNYGYAVLSSNVQEFAASVVYTMQEARLTFAYTASCDRTGLYEVVYVVDKATGSITRSVSEQRSFLSRRSGGQLSLCN